MVDEAWDAAVGSVAQETARLLQALGAQAASAAAEAADGAAAAADADPRPPGEAEASAPPDATALGSNANGDQAACACGHGGPGQVPMGQAQACTWCPVCRGVVLVRQLSPQTLASLADVAMMAATALADLASRQAAGGVKPSTAAGTPSARPGRGGSGARAAGRVEDITVLAESEAGAEADEPPPGAP